MEPILGILCVLAFLVLAVTVLGHGLWLMFAAIFRALAGEKADRQPPARPCPSCGRIGTVVSGRCQICGAVPAISPPATLLQELEATARHLERMVHRGIIRPDEYERLRDSIQADLARLKEERPSLQPVQPSPPVAATTEEGAIDAILVEGPAANVDTLSAPSVAGNPFAPSAPLPSVRAAGVVHPLDRNEPIAPRAPAKPSAPARTLADMLQSFMEESNIRWGEVIAGILIVVCAIGLVISLRSTLKAIPYAPALLFMLFTVAFHGAGLYSLRRWNLHAVSRVILIIALLLVPLGFSAGIVLSGSGETRRPLTDPIVLTAVIIGTLTFGWVTVSAARATVGNGWWRLSLAVLGTSLVQVVISRLAREGMSLSHVWLLSAVPLGCFLVAAGGQLLAAGLRKRFNHGRIVELFLVLGIAAFSLCVPLALLVHLSGESRSERLLTLAHMSPTISLAASAILAAGLAVHLRTLARTLTSYRFTGTTVAIVGGILMLLCVVLAWPRPDLLLAVGIANSVVLFALALVSRLTPLYAAGLASFAAASVIGTHVALGSLPLATTNASLVTHLLLTCRSGLVLTVLAAIAGGAGWQLLQLSQRKTGIALLQSAAVMSGLAGLVAIFAGFVPAEVWRSLLPQDALWAAPLLMGHGFVLIVAAPRWKHPAAAIAGSALLWLGLVPGIGWNGEVRRMLDIAALLPQRPFLCATLVHAVLCGLIALITAGRGVLLGPNEFVALSAARRWKQLVQPLSLTAAATLCGALPFVLWASATQLYWHAAYAAWGTGVCLVLLLIWRHEAAFASLQGMLALAGGFLTAAVCRDWLDLPSWRWDWRHFDAQLIVVALSASVWSLVRRASVRWPSVRPMITSLEVSVDQGLLAVAVIAAPLLALVAAWPGILRELDATLLAAEMPLAKWTTSAGGPWDWLATGAVACAMLTLLFSERLVREALVGLVIVLFAVPWLLAGHFAQSMAVASAARWMLAGYVALLAVASLLARRYFADRRDLLGRTATVAAQPRLAICPFVLGGAAILAITLAVVAQSVRGNPIGGPSAGSWFAALGPTLSFGVPLSVLVIVSLAFSLAWRRGEMSIVAAVLFQLTTNLAFLIHLSGSASSEEARVAEWLQWNGVALGLFGWLWSAVEFWKLRRSAHGAELSGDVKLERAGLQVQVGLAAATVLLLALWAGGMVAAYPSQTMPVTAQLGYWTSYAAAGLSLTLLVWKSRGQMPYAADGIVAVSAMLTAFAAATSDGYDPARQWLAYHVLSLGMLAIAAAAAVWHAAGHARTLLLDETKRGELPFPRHGSVAIAGGIVAWLALRGTGFDPQAPWWSTGTAAGAVLIFSGLALVRRSQVYAYVGTLLAACPAGIFLIDAPPWAASGTWIFVEACLVAPLLCAGFWLWCEIRSQRREETSFDRGFPLLPVHRFAGAAGVAMMGLLGAVRLLVATAGVMDDMPLARQLLIEISQAATLVVLLLLLSATLWDRQAKAAVALLYGCGLLFVGFVLQLFRWPIYWQFSSGQVPPFSYSELLLAAAPLTVAAYVALTGELWKRGARLSRLGQRLGVSDPVAGLMRIALWLPTVSLLLTLGVCGLSFFAVLSLPSLALRVTAALAPAVAGWGIARQAQQNREAPLQAVSLALAGLSAVLLGWAELPPVFTEALWMTRMFRLLMVLSALTFLYGLALPRWLLVTGSWNRSLQRAGYVAAVLAIASFASVLALEFALFVPGRGAPVADVQVIAVAVVLVALVAGLISLALFPARDPLAFSERGRTAYVYAAEAVLALLFAHLYLCKPLWFGLLRPYWPYVVMAIAYVGVGASELFSRLRIHVLAEPLRNTGALLPLLPAIAMWLVAPLHAPQWAAQDYALVLLLAGLMYLAVSMTQRSWLFGAAAGIAGNGSLWAIFTEHHFDFSQRPQFWLIPPAVSVLIAAHVNRRRLDPRLLTAIRYAATIVIYISSTSEIYIHGIGNTVWPPLILLSLSLVGALAGVMFRVRAFLYLGATFTLMALITMVAHAARAIDETWPWWAFGIGLGIAMLALFAWFEKNRAEVQDLVARLRQWEQ